MDAYIYYRVAALSEKAVPVAVRHLHTHLRLTGERLSCGLKRRPDVVDGFHTWMEIYENVPEGFASRLENALVNSPLQSLIDGRRHVEYFMECQPCV